MKRYLIATLLSILAGIAIAAEINDLEPVDASNTARFPESMPLSAVNDGARSLEAILARWSIDAGGRIDSTGTQPHYAVAASQNINAYYDGLEIAFTAHTTNSAGASTLNVDSVGASTMKKTAREGLIDLVAGDIPLGSVVTVVYDDLNSQWVLTSSMALVGFAELAVANVFTAVQTIDTAGQNTLVLSSDIQGDLVVHARIRSVGHDDGGGEAIYSEINFIQISDAAGAEAGRLDFRTADPVDGALDNRAFIAKGLWMDTATGGDKGPGTINAVELYEAGVQVSTAISATQAQQEATSSSTVYVTPSVQHLHPSAAKCFGKVTYSSGVPSLTDGSYNIDGDVSDDTTGTFTVTILDDFSSTDYVIITGTLDISSAQYDQASIATQATTSFQIEVFNGGSLVDPADGDGVYFTCYGDQ